MPRIFNSHSPRLREDGLYDRAMSRFIMQALKNEPVTVYGEGKQTRSFCYITDTATGLLLLATCERAKGEVVNVGNTQEVTILELAQRIKENAKCKSTIEFRPLPKDDPKRRCPDTSKLEKVVGWKPNVSFEERLERTIKWFVSKKRSSQIEQEKRKNMHEPPDPNYAESLFPLQFSSVQITRSRKHLALSTLNIQG